MSAMWHYSNAVQRAMRAVPRDAFLPAHERDLAVEDSALPIACGQTISQPSLVAYMTDQLDLRRDDRVLEIGTGSGYQTAILAELAAEVFTIERIAALADSARERLVKLGYGNVRFRLGDGAFGWPEEAPFDAIIVTAAASRVPSALIDQLNPGARLVIPVGEPHTGQELMLIQKCPNRELISKSLCDVRFVPLLAGTM